MKDRTGRDAPNGLRWGTQERVAGRGRDPVHDDFPATFVEWVTKNRDLVEALVALRRLGPEASSALSELLGSRCVTVFELSWQLWSALVEGEGGDAEARLLEVVPVALLDHVRRALRGDPWDYGPRPVAA